MAKNTQSSIIKDHLINDSIVHRPTTLSNITTNTQTNFRHIDVDNLCRSPSSPPLNTRPRFFRAGTLFDSNTYDKILSSVYNDVDDNESDNDIYNEEELFDEKALKEERAQEIQQLNRTIRANQPINDDVAASIMQQLNDILETTNEQHPYPPINQSGHVEDHDRPHADYGHLDRQTIAQEFNFNLQPSPSPSSSNQQRSPLPRLHAKSFAITSFTNVSKDLVMNKIKDEFGIENIQYICIGEELSELNHQQHLHIQIILKDKVHKRKRFLDSITQTHCNYQVTQNDLAWNEYIKKGGNYIEFNEFKSVRTRGGQKEWPTSSSSSISSSSLSTPSAAAAAAAAVSPLPLGARITTTVRAQTAERRQHEENLAKQALHLAETSVDNAMDFIREHRPAKFLERCTWYLATFNYIHLRTQHDADRRGDPIDKEFIWPHSFPNCTPKLRDAMNQWIRHHFCRAQRAKCLILIGPTGTGKTSFALSLPGRINYFQEKWNLDIWNNYARYSVYDDIPWDNFENCQFPSKKNLLTQKKYKIQATDKYRQKRELNVRQPAIVLLNPEDAGSLLAEPITDVEKKTAEYWKKRAFVYIMGPNEYFYKRQSSKDNDHQTSSSNSSMSTNEERLGDSQEFEKMYRHYQQKHSK